MFCILPACTAQKAHFRLKVITWPFFCHSLLINLLTDDQRGGPQKTWEIWRGLGSKFLEIYWRIEGRRGVKKRKICSGNNFYRCSPMNLQFKSWWTTNYFTYKFHSHLALDWYHFDPHNLLAPYSALYWTR